MLAFEVVVCGNSEPSRAVLRFPEDDMADAKIKDELRVRRQALDDLSECGELSQILTGAHFPIEVEIAIHR